jgi:hypothetical protein
MDSSVVGRTEEERDLLCEEGESDVGGDDLSKKWRRRLMTHMNAHYIRMSEHAWDIVRWVE